jgi:hypothetical protein
MVFVTEMECVYCAAVTESAVTRVTIHTIKYTGKLSVLPTQCIYVFEWICEQTAIISLYSINWLFCITETECVYCAVRTERIQLSLIVVFERFNNPLLLPAKVAFSVNSRQVGHKWAAHTAHFGHSNSNIVRFVKLRQGKCSVRGFHLSLRYRVDYIRQSSNDNQPWLFTQLHVSVTLRKYRTSCCRVFCHLSCLVATWQLQILLHWDRLWRTATLRGLKCYSGALGLLDLEDWFCTIFRNFGNFMYTPNLVTWCTNKFKTFNNCTLCPHCICVYLRTNSDLCHLQHKLIGFITELKSVYSAVWTGSLNEAAWASSLND